MTCKNASYFDFYVNTWSIWPDTINKETLTQDELLAIVPKMLKRRLTPLARIVFCAASQCLSDNQQIPSVFSSVHGELAKSFKMMELIQAGEDISPTAFSLSVHNAVAGLFSMIYKNKQATTVVAPGEEGVAAAFLEALGLLQEGAEEVLMVFYDEPLVSFYPSKPYNLSSKTSLALALVISHQPSGIALRLSHQPLCAYEGEQPVQLPLLINLFSSDQQELTLHTPRHSWLWEKR